MSGAGELALVHGKENVEMSENCIKCRNQIQREERIQKGDFGPKLGDQSSKANQGTNPYNQPVAQIPIMSGNSQITPRVKKMKVGAVQPKMSRN